MSNLNRNLTVLLHMKEYCEQIEKTFDMFGKNIEDFNINVVFRNAISMPIFQIGELVNHLTEDYIVATQNDINWNEIRGMRNRFAHGYYDMDYSIIFDTAINDIPLIKEFIDKEIKKLMKESRDTIFTSLYSQFLTQGNQWKA